MKFTYAGQVQWDKVKQVIFDWGGVIVDIDYHATVNAFTNLGIADFQEQFTQYKQSTLFKDFEIGKATWHQVCDFIRAKAGQGVGDEAIADAWNAMLLDTPAERIGLLKKLRTIYPIYLLSNTNQVHVDNCMGRINHVHQIDFKGLFTKVYLSHEVGLRKPTREIFEFVLDDIGVVPSETLYIDDTEEHIDTADALGFQAFYLPPPLTITNIFNF